ncbi:hypothetical protein [Streptomyces sp. CA-111067]|uniref:hypothetical protein n=1 Tax=Streptomyces sp. CA-111067 TaxID=3240046 RepID=UPI003D967EB1
MGAQGDKLRGEKTRLHQLSTDTRALLDSTTEIAADRKAGDQSWSGPQAERVRGELKVWKGKLATIADQLDAEGGQRGRDADAADSKFGRRPSSP